MVSIGVRPNVAGMESIDIIEMSFHSFLQSLLGGPNICPASDRTMDLVHQDLLSADVIIATAFCRAIGTVAGPCHEIFREDPGIKFPN